MLRHLFDGIGKIAWEDILSNFDNTIANSNTPPLKPGLPGTGVSAWNDPGHSDKTPVIIRLCWARLYVALRAGEC